jgi:enterochelin esterase-like enzyme
MWLEAHGRQRRVWSTRRPRVRARRRTLAVGLLAVALLAAWQGIGAGIGAGAARRSGHDEPARPAIGVAEHAGPGARMEKLAFFSPALHHAGRAFVYLPPGYARAAAHGRRYPVLYVLHGAPGVAARIFKGGLAARDASLLIAAHRIRPLIIVAPYGLYGSRNVTEWADGRYGPYERYVLDVVRATDARLPTVPDRAHRVIAGDSEGGYGATNIALHNLRVFAGLQSWSGYFTAPRTGTFAGASAVTIARNSPIAYGPALTSEIRRLGLRAYLYEGAQDRNGSMGMPQFAAELRAAGASVGSAVYPGRHDWALWRAQMPHMLVLASRWMSSRATSGGTAAAGAAARTARVRS